MSYVEELERQNEDLRQKLAATEKKLIDKIEDTDRRLPQWFKRSDTNYYYGWDIRNIADIRKSGDPHKPWTIWIAGDDHSMTQGTLRTFKTAEDAKAMVELIFSNAAVRKE